MRFSFKIFAWGSQKQKNGLQFEQTVLKIFYFEKINLKNKGKN
jgi:hypothetical protein